MEKIKHWKARRSGGRITITGIDETGHAIKVAAIDTITVEKVAITVDKMVDRPVVVATDKNGERFELVVA